MWYPGQLRGCTSQDPLATASLTPLILDDEIGDKVLGLIGDALKGLLVEVPVGSQDVVQCLGVIVTQEGGEAAEPGGAGR